MCGGCNILAEGAGASVIVARYWWVARQGRRAVAEAEALLLAAAESPTTDAAAEPALVPAGFVDPLPDVLRLT